MTPYETNEDGLDVLWDSSLHMPETGPDEFDRGSEALLASLPDEWRDEAAARLADSESLGASMHPFDASQLHVWRLFDLERGGFRTPVDGCWTSPDGLANAIVAPDEDAAPLVEAARAQSWPVLRLWSADGQGELPYRFRLVRV